MSFVARQALSVARTKVHNPNPGNLPFFSSRGHPRRHGLVSGPRGSCHPPSSFKRVCSSLESIQIRCMLNSTVSPRVDFVQDLYLEGFKGCKSASKVPHPASSPDPRAQPQSSLVTLTFFLGCRDHSTPDSRPPHQPRIGTRPV